MNFWNTIRVNPQPIPGLSFPSYMAPSQSGPSTGSVGGFGASAYQPGTPYQPGVSQPLLQAASPLQPNPVFNAPIIQAPSQSAPTYPTYGGPSNLAPVQISTSIPGSPSQYRTPTGVTVSNTIGMSAFQHFMAGLFGSTT